MQTFTLFEADFCPDWLEIIKIIFSRMGWAYDEEDNTLIINVPFDDYDVFTYIFQNALDSESIV